MPPASTEIEQEAASASAFCSHVKPGVFPASCRAQLQRTPIVPVALIQALQIFFPASRQVLLGHGGIQFALADGSSLHAWPTAFMFRDSEGNELENWFGDEIELDWPGTIDGIMRKLDRSHFQVIAACS